VLVYITKSKREDLVSCRRKSMLKLSGEVVVVRVRGFRWWW
jgi:hypothetical protein